MKKTLLTIASAAAIGVLAYAAGTAPKSLPRTVQGVDYASTLPTADPNKAPAIVPASDYPEDPDDLGVPAGDFTFDMIESWAGEGENRAALVIQFNDDRESNAIVFGYRWNGQATGSDMIRAVVAANPRLYGLIQYTNVSSPTDPNGGYTINGFGWDLDDDGDISLIDTNDNKVYTSEDGLFIHPRGYVPGQGGSPDYDYDNWKATDPDDFWGAGWYISYWSYWVKEGDASSFSYSGWGASGRVLSDGSWDGWNFSLNMTPRDWKTFVAAPIPIPEDAKTLFKNNGIYYSLKSYSSKTVIVCAPTEMEGETLGEYSGDITIPATFVDEDIEYKVVAIGASAFASSEVTTVTIPETVTEIGDDAFSASTLSALKFAGEGSIDQIKKLGERAFSYTAITEPLFSGQISKIPAAAFAGTKITEVSIPEWVDEIGEMSFADNQNLAKVVIPASVKTIGSGAFAVCPALTDIKVETTVAPAITDDCFDEGTYNNAILTVPVGYPAYYAQQDGWKYFQNIAEYTMEIHEGDLFDMNGASFRITSIGEKNEVILTYKRVEGKPDRTSITAANKAGYIGDITIAPTVQYQNVTFNVTAMNDSTFYGASDLTGVVLPEGIPSITNHAFFNCTSLASVTIPASVETIGNYAFANIDAIQSIVLPEGLKSLGERAFYYCRNLKSINLPSGLTELPNNLFCYANSLESIEVPESVTSFGTYVFDNCTSLKSVKLPSSLTSIPNYTFNKCSSLTEINLPDGVTTIGNSAFASCTGLTEIKLPAGVTSVGTSAFSGCSGLTEISLPEGVKTLGNSLFLNCTSLRQVNMSPDVTLSGTQIFRGCSALETVAYYGEEESAQPGVFRLPANTTTLQNYTISGCSKITEIILPSGLTTINNYGLSQTSITNIDLPESITSILDRAFEGSTLTGNVVIPSNVTRFGNYLARSCNDIKFYICNPTPASTSSYTFSSAGTSGPFFPIVVPTGTTDDFKGINNWAKSEITAPSVTKITAEITDIEPVEDKYVVSGNIIISYDMTELPAKFEAANTARLFQNAEIRFEIESAAKSTASGEITVNPDGTFSVELEGLASESTYQISLTANLAGEDYTSESVSFETPLTTGINDLVVSEETTGDFYSVSGVCMASGISVAEARTTLPAGLYLIRAEGKTSKIVIR